MKDNQDYRNMSAEKIQFNAAILMMAGSKTTAIALAEPMTYLIQNSESLRKVTVEIRARFNKEKDIIIAAIKELSYLNATINEGLRLCNPVPGGLPRVVGKGGDTVCNVFVSEFVSHDMTGPDITVRIMTTAR